ncbi:CorA family divalent cation transporter [Acinetobacter sp. Marseille-Q1618]|uniref:CorA family divalent cation transporter n=1 Tax=Acinetobacter sp. Marseille-Q1618 TaxID=2697502 RepID=UPI00156DBA35|nr:CorA family divalent cation transporter [Acinetobacter sp. Marseille-Q1618]
MNLDIQQKIAQFSLKNQPWIRLHHQQVDLIQALQKQYNINISDQMNRAVIEENGFFIIPIELVVLYAEHYVETRIVFAFNQNILISLEDMQYTDPLDHAQHKLNEHLENVLELHTGQLLFHILQSLNETTHIAIREISLQLDERSELVALASGGFEFSKSQAGVADIADTAIALGEAEELVAKTIEGQLMLARASRWLRRMSKQTSLHAHISLLISDIHSLKRYALFQHDKIRNLQQSLMTTMDIKQNQVVKVFTVVTAVFTPPTLITAFYGQNFAYMPELTLQYGEWIVMLLTGFFSLVPLLYIKYKGWMR